jgi:hypothetical protein
VADAAVVAEEEKEENEEVDPGTEIFKGASASLPLQSPA